MAGHSHSHPHPPFAAHNFGLPDPGRPRATNEDVFAVGELASTLLVRHTDILRGGGSHPQPE